MKRSIIISGLGAALLMGAISAQATPTAGHGAMIAGYGLETLAGQEFSVAEHRGEVIVVNFWATWCKPCLKELPLLDSWNDEIAPRGGRIIAISVDTRKSKVEKFVRRSKLLLTVCHDGPGGLAKRLDLSSLPCTYVIDAEGDVAYIARKGPDEELPVLRRIVDQLLAGRPGLLVPASSERK